LLYYLLYTIMRKLFIGLFSSLVLFLVGCGRAAPSAAAPVTSQAPVERVQVISPAGSPNSFQVLVHGQLPDGCMRLGEPAVSRGDGLVVIILPAFRSPDAKDCGSAQAYDRVIPLADGLAPGRYSVSVNGVSESFSVPGSSVAGATPKAAPTQGPSPTATQAAPTPTSAAAPDEPTSTPTTPVVDAAPTPTKAADPAANSANAPDCEVKAAFTLDLTVPDGSAFDPGEKFTKSWRIRNAGTCTWQGYSLIYQDGSAMGSTTTQGIPGSVAPGKTVDISIDFTAPQTPGAYFSDWLLSTAEGKVFGLGNPSIGLLWLKIGVRAAPAANPLPQAGGDPNAEKLCAYQTSPEVITQLLDLINAARVQNGLTPFKMVDGLSSAALLHSADMACHDFVDHYGYDGSTWMTRIKAQGVAYRSASENIYAGSPDFGGTPQGAFNWWMNSKVHHDNILNPKSTQIGIGYVFYAGSTYKGYYTLNFIQP
jgi:uncharacterized protein YkwD